MNRAHLTLVLFVITAPISSLAMGKTPKSPLTECQGPCYSAPISAELNRFPLERAQKAYEQGDMPTFEQLKGSWKKVGIATQKKPWEKLWEFWWMTQDTYDADGIKVDMDGSIETLVFEGGPSLEPDFAGNAPINEAVTFLNSLTEYSYSSFIIKKQGPNRVEFDAKESVVCFAKQYLGVILGDRYEDVWYYPRKDANVFSSKCRLLKSSVHKMICQIKYGDELVQYVGFVKNESAIAN
jgi:hypothetical protein